jgi:chemotaxis protein methyltransferase CheR
MSETRSGPMRSSVRPDLQGLRVPERTLPLLRDLVQSHAGLYYDDGRLESLGDRLSPLAVERGFDSLLDYYYLLKYDSEAAGEWIRAVDALSVQETYFWREADQLHALTAHLLPRLVQLGRRRIRIWSVPCASGEEPLSIALALEESGWFARLPIEIHASDASEAALRKAAAGHYAARSFRQLAEPLREKYFDYDGKARDWVVKPSLKARVTTWSRVNVVQPVEVAALATADVIFCRNLFIYFTPSTIRQVTEQFADRMPSPGYLCVGAAESLLRVTSRFELQEIAGSFVYLKP